MFQNPKTDGVHLQCDTLSVKPLLCISTSHRVLYTRVFPPFFVNKETSTVTVNEIRLSLWLLCASDQSSMTSFNHLLQLFTILKLLFSKKKTWDVSSKRINVEILFKVQLWVQDLIISFQRIKWNSVHIDGATLFPPKKMYDNKKDLL